jgi:hypothetical protein
LEVIDASDPAYLKTSVLEGVPFDLGYFQDFKVNGSRLYIATRDKLSLFDLISKDTVAPRGAYTVSTARVDAVRVMEQRAFILGSSGLELIDVSDPSSPGLLGRIPAGVTDLSIHNQFAYVIDGPQMQIFDVSDPSNPTLRGTFAVSDTLHAVDINNNFTYLVSGENLSIVDVGNAAAPMLRGTYALTHGTGQAIQVDGIYAYLATFGNLDIVDVSDPLSPKIQSSVQAPQAQSVYVAGDRLYTANGQYGLQICDISMPTAPLLRAHKLWANTSYVRAAGDLLYTASSYGVQIIDVHDPADPLPRATFTTIDHPRRIQVVGDLVFVADGDGGLLILRVHPERFPEPTFLPVIGH